MLVVKVSMCSIIHLLEHCCEFCLVLILTHAGVLFFPYCMSVAVL